MTSRIGIAAYGSYVPYWRLQRQTVNTALGKPGGKGARAVAAYDEDTTTMAVEAARRAVAALDSVAMLGCVISSTADPVYADKTNATTVHAVLELDHDMRVSDQGGAARSGIGALIGAFYQPGGTLVTLADTRSGPSGSPEEAGTGDAAAAFIVGDGKSLDLIAELVGTGSGSAEFLDRWRAPGEPWAATWEERFGESVYVELAGRSFENALKSSGLTAGEINRFAVTGLSPRAAKIFAKGSGVPADAIVPDLEGEIGNTGTAHPGVLLAAMLDEAKTGELIAVTMLADGADTILLRVTDAIDSHRRPRSVKSQIDDGNGSLSYLDFLSWKGAIVRQSPRRPDPERAVAPASFRQSSWKYGFSGSKCTDCGTRHMPPQRVCLKCGANDHMLHEKLSDVGAKVATYTIDHLAFSLAPPVVGVVIDFDGGGRFSCEMTDCDPENIEIGQRAEMTFRKISTASGIANYFWKARPAGERITS